MDFCNCSEAPPAIGPYSQAVFSHGFYFFSGQIALTKDGQFLSRDIRTETLQVLCNIQSLLKAQSLTKENVIKCTVFLDNIENFETVNEIYSEFFENHKPARSCVEVAKLPRGAKVEIEVIAETPV